MLGVPHVNQLPPLIVGQVPPGQARELLVQGSAEQAQVVAHLSIGKVLMEGNWRRNIYLAADHILFPIPVKGKHKGLVAVRFRHHQEKTMKGTRYEQEYLNCLAYQIFEINHQW